MGQLRRTSYSSTDDLGSPVAGAQVQSVDALEPYGGVAAGANLADLGFTGHMNEPLTGLVYMQQRYYDPLAGRFLSTDPVTTDANTGAMFDRYMYANNNPYRYTDPDGRCVEDFCIGEAIVVGRFAWGAYRAYRAAEQVAKAVEAIQSIGNKGGNATPAPIPAAGAPDAASTPAGSGAAELDGGKPRNAPPAPLPEAEGQPHSIVERPGSEDQYTT